MGADGSRQTVPVRGGVDVAEYRAPEPGWPMADYVGPRVVWTGSAFVADASTTRASPVRLYGSTMPLTQPFDAVAVEVRMVATVGRLHLFGLGLHDEQNVVASVRAAGQGEVPAALRGPDDDAGWRTRRPGPRVSIVGEVLAANGPTTADRLHELAWDPSRQAVVEGLRAGGRRPRASAMMGRLGRPGC